MTDANTNARIETAEDLELVVANPAAAIRRVAGNSLAAISSVGHSAGNRNQREGEGECSVTIRHRGLRTGQKTGQRNTAIRPEMEAKKFQPGVSGNPGGRPAKIFTAALLRILEKKITHDPDGRALLDAIVQQLVA